MSSILLHFSDHDTYGFVSRILGLSYFLIATSHCIIPQLSPLKNQLNVSDGIGWIKAFGCDEFSGDPFQYTSLINNTDTFIEYAKYAISLKMVPRNGRKRKDFEVQTVTCSNPIWNLNRGKEMSYRTDTEFGHIIDQSDLGHWIGSDVAKSRLFNSCILRTKDNKPFNLENKIYHACGNYGGIHLMQANPQYTPNHLQCEWDLQENLDKNIDLYLGFDPDLEIYCEIYDSNTIDIECDDLTTNSSCSDITDYNATIFCINNGNDLCPYISISYDDSNAKDINIYADMYSPIRNISIYVQNANSLHLICDGNSDVCSYIVLNTSNVSYLNINGLHANLSIYTQQTKKLVIQNYLNTNIYYNNDRYMHLYNDTATISIILYTDIYGHNKGYIALYDAFVFKDARKYCGLHFGTQLATISSDDDAKMLYDLMNMPGGTGPDKYIDDFWIGLTDASDDGLWMFTDMNNCDGNCVNMDHWSHCGRDTTEPCDSWNNCGCTRHNAPYSVSEMLASDYCDWRKRAICNAPHHQFIYRDSYTNMFDDKRRNIYIANNESLYLICDGSSVCSDIVIDGINAERIHIQCSDNNACRRLTLNASNAMNIEIYSSNGGLKNASIYAENVNKLQLFCHTKEGCSDVIINALNATDINIYATYHKALVNSVIYAQNVNTLNVSCLKSVFYAETCMNVEIHLSSKQYSNTINCDGLGCNGINLYFENNVDLSVFDNIILNGCKTCKDGIQEWNIYYYQKSDSPLIYNHTFYYDNGPFIDNTYLCNYASLINEEMVVFCMFIGLISTIALFTMFTIIVIKSCVKIYKKISHKFVSSFPESYVLLFSSFIDILTYISVVWWTIKTILFYCRMKQYCSQYDIDGVQNVYCNNVLKGIVLLMVLSIIVTVECIVELVMSLWCNDIDTHTKYCYIPYDCCMFYACSTKTVSHTMYKNTFNKIYRERQLWAAGDLKLYGYFALFTYRYLILILPSFINMIVYGNKNTDYSVKWYTMYPILTLLIFKLVLQLSYIFGPKYKNTHEIDGILSLYFGNDIILIIKMYLPLFHDTSLCSSGTLITQDLLNKFQTEELPLI